MCASRSTPEARFGEVRSLLQQPPSEAAYEQLCAFLERANPQEALEVLLPYARTHMDRTWPDELRPWLKTWTRRFIKGEPLVVAGLAKRCELSGRRLDRSKLHNLHKHEHIQDLDLLDLSLNEGLGACLAEVAALPLLRGVRRLNLRRLHTKDREGIRALLDHPSLSKLVELNCAGIGQGSMLETIVGSSFGLRVETLICSASFADDELPKLLATPLPKLKRLSAAIYKASASELERAIDASPWWNDLEELWLMEPQSPASIREHWALRPRALTKVHLPIIMGIEPEGMWLYLELEGLEALEEVLVGPHRQHELNLELLRRLKPAARLRLLEHWRSILGAQTLERLKEQCL